ncbi:MAG TPA: HAMP domain-containing sensor histidine kinase [Vicinamibacterales bacterium]|nr:HAMP domain-containing sensor histidine kinase [Vicinamibacterales bacterium]
MSQVVHDYGDVCQSVTELAIEKQTPINADDFRTLNACLDDAIAVAVTEFARERDQGFNDGEAILRQGALDRAAARRQSGIDDETIRGSERLAFFAHELRNLLNAAGLAFEALKTGNVGIGGSTSGVLGRSLAGAGDLISRTLAEVRLTENIQHRERFPVSEFVSELEANAALAAGAARVTLHVTPVADDLVIEGDRQVLTAVIMNLLQNAFKFTGRDTTVTLRVEATAERVLIDIQDECGGLPPGNVEDLFRPFEQRGLNRKGLGLGLAFSRWGVEANHGTLTARSLPGRGCIFTIDLPRALATPA